MPVFQAGDTGANPVEATISLRKRRLLIRNRSTLLPCRIFSGACQQPELAGANLVCVRSVRATRRSASPQFRVRVPARAPWSCGVNSQHSGLLIRQVRVQIPPAPPTIATCQSSRADARRNLPAPSDLSRGFPRRARAAKGPACKTGVIAGASPAVVSMLWGCSDNSSTPRPQRGGDGA